MDINNINLKKKHNPDTPEKVLYQGAELACPTPRLTQFPTQVRSDYQQLRRELVEVQELQRDLSSRLRSQLRLVHGKFARLRQRIAAVPPPR